MRSIRLGVLVPVTLSLVVGCARGSDPVTSALEDDAITVASFDFPESVLLAELYAQALEAGGYRIDRQTDLGPREIVGPALARGLIELVPEYSGSALAFFSGPGAAPPQRGATYAELERSLATRGIVALRPAPAQDHNGFVVTEETATRYDLRTLSDLLPIADTLTFGGPTECPRRPLCLQGLERTYGLDFGGFVPLDAGGPLTVAALRSGDVQVGLMFTSSGAIDVNGFVLLEDDRHLQPAENVTPVLRREVLERFGPAVRSILDAVSIGLTTNQLRRLNAAVADGRSPSQVAAQWLDENGLGGDVG